MTKGHRRVYSPPHQVQVDNRCGIHAINNALGDPLAVTAGDADRVAKVLEKKEAEFLQIKGWSPTLASPGGNFLDVVVVMELIRCLG